VKRLFSPEGLAELERLARSSCLVGLDFDGTLASLVDDPPEAQLSTSTRAVLERVARRFPTVVISGRAREDLASRLAALPLAALVGNHGLEPPPVHSSLDAARAAARVQAWLGPLSSAFAASTAIQIEDKRLSLAIHYRTALDHAAAERAIAQAIAALEGARVVLGKHSVNLIPAGAPHKGDALLDLRAQHDCQLALFVGDDVTDEDAFGAAGVVGIRVGQRDGSLAAFFVDHREEVDLLLERLAELRGPHV